MGKLLMLDKIAKKIITIILLINFILLYISPFCSAENSEAKTGLDISSINISNKQATVGNKIKISFRIDNISGDVKYVDAWYSKPIADDRLTDKISFKYNMQNGLFETELDVTNTWINGEYKFNRLFISVGDYSESYYNINNTCINQYGVVTNLDAFNFSIYGVTGDETPPYIDTSTLEISNDRFVNGDTVSYKVRIIDNTSIKSATLKLAHEVGRYEYSYKSISLLYNNTSNLYEANLKIDDTLAGYWSVYSISATDKFNNTYTLYNSRFYSATSTNNNSSKNLMAATFKNYQTYPDAKLENNELILNSANLTSGDNLNISMVVSDDFKIDNIKLYYNKGSETDKLIIEPKFEKVKYSSGASYGGVTYYTTTTEQYSVNMNIEKYGCNCDWILDRIEITNKAGNTTTLYNKQVYPYSLTDLSSGNFTTYGLVENSVEVDNDNIILNNNKRTHQIVYNVVSNGEAGKSAIFKSSDESVAIVSSNGLITAQKNGSTTISIISLENNSIKKDITVEVNMNSELPSVTSNIQSAGDESEIITIKLLKKDDNTEIMKSELNGKNKKFIIPSIESGEYIIEILKKSHRAEKYPIKIDDLDIDLNIRLYLNGDSNGDDKVNITDVALINSHVKKVKILTGDELVRADINGDGKVNITDVALVNSHVKKVKMLED